MKYFKNTNKNIIKNIKKLIPKNTINNFKYSKINKKNKMIIKIKKIHKKYSKILKYHNNPKIYLNQINQFLLLEKKKKNLKYHHQKKKYKISALIMVEKHLIILGHKP